MRSSFLSFRHQYQERVAPCLICIPDGWPSAIQNCPDPACNRVASRPRDMKFGGSKTTEVHQERRARPWRAPGGGLDAIIKTPSPPLVTYKIGGRESQIDFLMCRRQQLKEVKNCKVFNGKSVAAQHRVLVLDWEIKCSNKRIPEQVTTKIKWWKLKVENIKIQFREKVLRE